MKITILFLAVISLAFVSTTEMCRTLEVEVYSSMQPTSQSFTIDVKKIRGVDFLLETQYEESFKSAELIPIEQTGFVLEKTATSKVLDKVHHEYLRNEPESVWLPYAYTGNWSGAGYIIAAQMTRTSNSKTQTPMVFFKFMNDYALNSITSEDMDQFLTNLKYNADKRKNIKTDVKSSIEKAQSGYSSSFEAHKTMKANNKNTKEQIASTKITIEKTTKEIITLTTIITTTEAQIAIKSQKLSENDDLIDDVLSKIKSLTAQLRIAEADLLATKKTDITMQKNGLASVLLMVTYPQTAPGQFLDEYKIASGNKFSIVSDNYKYCNKKEATIENCQIANNKSSSTKRKLRRGFF
jgi:hypothetical protein